MIGSTNNLQLLGFIILKFVIPSSFLLLCVVDLLDSLGISPEHKIDGEKENLNRSYNANNTIHST